MPVLHVGCCLHLDGTSVPSVARNGVFAPRRESGVDRVMFSSTSPVFDGTVGWIGILGGLDWRDGALLFFFGYDHFKRGGPNRRELQQTINAVFITGQSQEHEPPQQNAKHFAHTAIVLLLQSEFSRCCLKIFGCSAQLFAVQQRDWLVRC